MPTPFVILADGWYDDVMLQVGLELSAAVLKQARRSGQLRHTRKGTRVLYMGAWVIDWLNADVTKASSLPCAGWDAQAS